MKKHLPFLMLLATSFACNEEDSQRADGMAGEGNSAGEDGGTSSMTSGGNSNGSGGRNSSGGRNGSGSTSSSGGKTASGSGPSSGGDEPTATGGTAPSIGGGPPGPSNSSVSTDKIYQTMDGFGVSINVHSWDDGDVIPALVELDEMGTRIWRVVYEMSDWEEVNDDDDPAHFDWDAYESIFSSPELEELWSTLEWLNDQGHTSNVMLDFMGRAPEWMGGATLDVRLKDEFVETIVAAAYYGRVTRGLEFGMLAPSNEVDWDGIEGPQIGAGDFAEILNDIVKGLADLGVEDLKIVGPDTASGSFGVDQYMPAMMGYPKLMDRVDSIAIHEYSPMVHGLMEAISSSDYPELHGWVTETSYSDDALYFIENGISAVLLWDGYDSVYRHAELAGRGSSPPNDAGPGPAALSFQGRDYERRDTYYQWKQLARYVVPGMQRISAKTSLQDLTLFAFRHPTSGELTILGRNWSAKSQTLMVNLGGLGAELSGFATNIDHKFDELSVSYERSVVSTSLPPDCIFTLSNAE